MDHNRRILEYIDSNGNAVLETGLGFTDEELKQLQCDWLRRVESGEVYKEKTDGKEK